MIISGCRERPVFADADHQKEDETDADTNYDTDNNGKQQTFTVHTQRTLSSLQSAAHHIHHSVHRLFISPVIFRRSSVIAARRRPSLLMTAAGSERPVIPRTTHLLCDGRGNVRCRDPIIRRCSAIVSRCDVRVQAANGLVSSSYRPIMPAFHCIGLCEH